MAQHILFEINEICPPLIEKFIASGDMPNFKKYKYLFDRYLTQADAEPPALEPWIQWYSLHTGIPYEQHHVFRLNEGSHAGHPDIWSRIRERGYKVMNFGSMNTARLDSKEDVFFPDPWSAEKSNPETLQPIADLIASQVREYTSPNFKVDYVKFTQSLLKNGLSLATLNKAIQQLLSERFKKTKHKRIFILDNIIMDLFFHYHKKVKPDFATVFTNSVAHIQHAYWRFFEPEKFQLDVDRPEFKNAVRDAYVNMDKHFGQLMRYALANNIYVSIASALSQRPYVKEEASGGRHYYRPVNVHDLLEKMNISPIGCEAVMTHQYILTFRSEDDRHNAEKIMASSRLIENSDDKQLFTVKNADMHNGLIFDCHARQIVGENAKIIINNQNHDFKTFFYLIDEIKSGGHDPIGLYWEQTSAGKTGSDYSEKIMVYDIFQRLLAPFDPNYQRKVA